MNITDDRTPQQRDTHTRAVVGTCRVLSGTSFTDGGPSYAAWAFDETTNAADLMRRIERRGDMLRVRMVDDLRNYRPRGHLSIYLVSGGAA